MEGLSRLKSRASVPGDHHVESDACEDSCSSHTAKSECYGSLDAVASECTCVWVLGSSTWLLSEHISFFCTLSCSIRPDGAFTPCRNVQKFCVGGSCGHGAIGSAAQKLSIVAAQCRNWFNTYPAVGACSQYQMSPSGRCHGQYAWLQSREPHMPWLPLEADGRQLFKSSLGIEFSSRYRSCLLLPLGSQVYLAA